MNEMDKLFGGGEETPQEDLIPESPNAGRPTIAQTAAAVARRRREAERMALVHEILLVMGMLALIAGGYYALRAYLNNKAEVERQRHENLMAEKARNEAAERARREEIAAENQRERARREQEQAARRREQEEKRAAAEKARSLAARFRAVKDMMRGATIDYFRNADDAERPGMVDVEATFLCLFPGGSDGCAFYEVKTVPGKKPRASRIYEDREPEAVPENVFDTLAAKKPYLVLRDRAGSRNNLKAYLVTSTKARRAAATAPVPDASGAYSPAKQDFGELYDAVKTLGSSRLAFKYRVVFSVKALAEPVVLPQTCSLFDVVTRATVESAVKRAIREQCRGNAKQMAEFPSHETLLESGTLSFRAVR